MKRIFIIAALMTSIACYGQDKLPDKTKPDTLSVNDGTSIRMSGTMGSHSGRTYTEIYEVITDSIVHRFGLEFRTSDSSFIRKVPMEGIDRRFYDQMKKADEFVLKNQERMRQETIDIINRHRASRDVWFHFKVLGIFGR